MEILIGFVIGLLVAAGVSWMIVEDHWATWTLGGDNKRSHINYHGQDYYPLLDPLDAFLDVEKAKADLETQRTAHMQLGVALARIGASPRVIQAWKDSNPDKS